MLGSYGKKETKKSQQLIGYKEKTNMTYREKLIELLQKNDEATDKQIYDEYFCGGSSFRGWLLSYTSTRNAINEILNMEYEE